MDYKNALIVFAAFMDNAGDAGGMEAEAPAPEPAAEP